MDRDILERLNRKLDELLLEFGGTITHRSRAVFLQKWRAILKEEGVKGDAWLDELLRLRRL